MLMTMNFKSSLKVTAHFVGENHPLDNFSYLYDILQNSNTKTSAVPMIITYTNYRMGIFFFTVTFHVYT